MSSFWKEILGGIWRRKEEDSFERVDRDLGDPEHKGEGCDGL